MSTDERTPDILYCYKAANDWSNQMKIQPCNSILIVPMGPTILLMASIDHSKITFFQWWILAIQTCKSLLVLLQGVLLGYSLLELDLIFSRISGQYL